MIHCLSPGDMFAINCFANEIVNLLPPTYMDQIGKERALGILEKVKMRGGTNLWNRLQNNFETESVFNDKFLDTVMVFIVNFSGKHLIKKVNRFLFLFLFLF